MIVNKEEKGLNYAIKNGLIVLCKEDNATYAFKNVNDLFYYLC